MIAYYTELKNRDVFREFFFFYHTFSFHSFSRRLLFCNYCYDNNNNNIETKKSCGGRRSEIERSNEPNRARARSPTTTTEVIICKTRCWRKLTNFNGPPRAGRKTPAHGSLGEKPCARVRQTRAAVVVVAGGANEPRRTVCVCVCSTNGRRRRRARAFSVKCNYCRRYPCTRRRPFSNIFIYIYNIIITHYACALI